MASFEVLMPLPGMAEIAERLERRVTLHKLWEANDREATLAAVAPNVRAIVSTWATARVDADADAPPAQARNRRRASASATTTSTPPGPAQHGIVVTHTPGVLDEDVADIAMALTLAATRRLPQAERHLRAGRWPSGPFPLTASLRGRTMGILGLGRIGKEIAKRAPSLRPRGRLSRPHAAGRRALSLLSRADRDGRGLRHPDGRRAGRRRDAANRQCAKC